MQRKVSMDAADNISQEVVNLLHTIEQANRTLSKTFENAILRHEQQFIKAYRTKMAQLNKLYDHLKYVLEDKFINNALMNRLQIVMKERDYFKYECLKLNTQYQNALEDHKNLTMQIRNITEQSSIYKHLLQSEKLRTKEIEQINTQLKNNLNDMAKRSSNELVKHIVYENDNINDENLLELNQYQNKEDKEIVLREQIKKVNSMKKQLVQYKKINKEQQQKIRILKLKVEGLQNVVNDNCIRMINKKQLQDVFRCCVENWKRQLNQKQKKLMMTRTCSSLNKTNNTLKHNNFLQLKPSSTFTETLFGNATISNSHESLTKASKKQLLRKFFTSPQFLQFIEDILFNDEIQIQIIKVQKQENSKYMQRNRRKLLQHFRNRKLVSQREDNRCRN